MFKKIYRKIFLSPYFFTIAIRRKSEKSIINEQSFIAEYVMPATPKQWYADPMLVDDNGKTYCFYEAVNKDKGHIEVVEIYDDCSISKPIVILKDDCHYSYPYVFKKDNEWFMIPESSAENEVRVYQATNFPTEWKLNQILLREKLVDTTILLSENILITFRPSQYTENVKPQAYKIKYHDKEISLNKIEWKQFDELSCRGAGNFFEFKGKIYRPVQVSSATNYGNKVAFYEIRNDIETIYQEQKVAELTPENIFIKDLWYDGTHTYNMSEKFEVIDVRCRMFDLFKIVRIVLKRIIKNDKVFYRDTSL